MATQIELAEAAVKSTMIECLALLIRWSTCIAAAILIVGTSPASAQTTPREFWRLALQGHDVSRVAPEGMDERVASAIRRLASYQRDPERRRGLAAVDAAQDALRGQQAPGWASLVYGAALARGPDVTKRSFDDRSEYFVDPSEREFTDAVEALKQSLGTDAEVDAAIEIARLALETAAPDLMDVARTALHGTTDPAGLIAESRLLGAAGDKAGAIRAADAALAAGADTALAMRARAIALFSDGDSEAGHSAYLTGVRALSEVSARHYFRDISAIVTEAEEREWDELGDAERAKWLDHFWQLRAADAGVQVHERLARHYQRLSAARAVFPITTPRLNPDTAYKTSEDPRRYGLTFAGLFLIRHGDPYRLDRTSCADSVGKRITAMPEGLIGMVPGIAQENTAEWAATRELMPEYMRLPCSVQREIALNEARGRPQWQARLAGAERLAMRLKATRTITAGNTYFPPFEKTLRYAWELFSFRGANGNTDVTTSVAIPMEGLRDLAVSSGAMFARLSVILIAGGVVSRHDTTIHAATPVDVTSGNVAAVIQGTVATRTSGPTDFRINVSSETGSVGAIARGQMQVRDLHGDGLQISDVVLAPQGPRASWRRGAMTVPVAPSLTTAPGQPLALYYEVYGASPDSELQTELVLAPARYGLRGVLRRLTGQEPGVLRLSFHDPVGQPHEQYGVQFLREIDTMNLEPGDYTLQIIVSDSTTGKSTRIDRAFTVSSRM